MAKTRKAPSESKDIPDEPKKAKKASSIRERNLKAAEAKDKPKRIRKAAAQAKKPVGSLSRLLTTEFHVFPQKEDAGFFTKSRSTAPHYFSDSVLELKNVTWPGRKETWKLVFAVFAFALTMGTVISVLDYGLEQLFRRIIL